MRNKATILAEALLQTEVEAICRKAIEEAKNGNIQAIKIILDRILPPKKVPGKIDFSRWKISNRWIEPSACDYHTEIQWVTK